MRKEIDYQLSKHFSLYEIMEGSELPKEAIEMNWKHFDEFNKQKFIELCAFMDDVREIINIEFKSDTSKAEIGFEVTAGFRCKEWELHQGRSGNSQHIIAAVDVQAFNCSNIMSAQILGWLYRKYNDRTTGHKGGFAIKRPKFDGKGNAVLVGFIHFDLRKEIARWEY